MRWLEAATTWDAAARLLGAEPLLRAPIDE